MANNPNFDPADLHVCDVSEACGNRSGQELHLRRPRRVVCLDRQHTLIESDWSNVCGDVLTDSVRPLAKHAADLDPIGPAQ